MEKTDSGRMEKVIATSIPFDSKEILTPEEAGALFGVTAWAMYKRAKKGMAPAHHMGKKVYFLKHELIESIRQL